MKHHKESFSFYNSLKRSPSIVSKTDTTDSWDKKWKKICFNPPNLTFFKDEIAPPDTYPQVKHEAFKSKLEL